MTYKTEKCKVTEHPDGNKDRRVKLTEEQKNTIRELHALGESQRALARQFSVSRRLISFVLDPSKIERNKELRELRGGWKQYYDKGKANEYTRNYRRYKHELFKDLV